MNNESLKSKPATGIFYSLMLLFAVGGLLLLPIATSSGPSKQGWWTQPIFMPALTLSIIVVPALILCWRHFRSMRANPDLRPGSRATRVELWQWLKPVEFFVYYVLYIWLLSLIGYFLSSLIFILLLSWRVGLRSKTWMLIALLFAITLVALFRWGLGVWVPQADLYELFPKDMRIFLMKNF